MCDKTRLGQLCTDADDIVLPDYLASLARARDSLGQLPQYAALIAGVRTALDDWVPIERLGLFKETCRELGLYVLPDCIFEPLDEQAMTSGSSIIPTTVARARTWEAAKPRRSSPDASLHVVVGRTAGMAREALASGWYPLFIRDRIVHKPLADHRSFGLALGYPECCVGFFVRNNDWSRLNTIAEALGKSTSIMWETNCFPKHSPFGATFHIPCSFDCSVTQGNVHRTLSFIANSSPSYADAIEAVMRTPVLSASEVLSYSLVGGCRDSPNCFSYDEAVFLGGKRREDRLGAALQLGDRVSITEGVVLVLQGSTIVSAISTRCDQGVVEVPVFLEFV